MHVYFHETPLKMQENGFGLDIIDWTIHEIECMGFLKQSNWLDEPLQSIGHIIFQADIFT